MIGKTNSMSGGNIKPDIVKVQLKTNQASHTDIVGAKITVNYASVSEVYTWEGSDISIKIPPYASYTISVNDIDGYKTPDIYNSMAIGGTTKSITFEYKCTIVTVEMDDNQPSYNDISTATATISSSGMTTKTISNGGTAKVPIGNVCTITWSDISGYKTPSSQTFTASGTSVTKIGTYQTEILTVNTVTPSDFSGSYTITVSGFGSHTTASKTYKIPFGTSYTVSASSVQGFSVTNSQSYTANSVSRTVTMEYILSIVDLSKQDIFGNPISQTTANSYVVKEAGLYIFPLVYGNAIKNGSTNSVAYTKVSGSNTHSFVNYNSVAISSPYIETDTKKTVSSVELSMADTDSIFADFNIINGDKCRYVQFEVKSIPATGANGVISVKDSSGTIMWSWHIWVWADDLTPIEITNSTGVKYNILPVNLASKKDTANDGLYINWYYQWGRHIPMLPSKTATSTTNATNYGVKSFTSSAVASSYSDGIKNPHVFYKNDTEPRFWFGSSKYYNFWDANSSKYGASDNDVVKTVYDPCPIGFKMPNGNTFTGFTKIGTINRGVLLARYEGDTTGVLFIYTGSRHCSNGGLSQVGNYSWVWTSASSYDFSNSGKNDVKYCLYLRSSYNPSTQYYGYTYASSAFSVRPVQE